jgi:dethiobiotin synthetase/adenosylmethionine--8-amino-7-oxononanoate aminotransferase
LLTRKKPPSDSSILTAVNAYLQKLPSSAPEDRQVVLIETAGGVHSPTPSATSQADLYRPLRLPVFLVADPKLGGISSTISAFESLHIRGYDLDSVLVFENDKYRNHEFLSEYFEKRNIATIYVQPPPTRREDPQEDEEALSNYYERISSTGPVQDLLLSSSLRHERRIERLESMASKAVDKIWYPFTQHKDLTPEKILTIDSAYGDYFQTLSPTPSRRSPATTTHSPSADQVVQHSNDKDLLQSTFDASASWWTQGLGHGSPDLSLAAAHAAGRYGHVMFAGAVHEPALSLAELLLEQLKNPRLQKVFYSDNGSTGVEVAIKMALTASSKRYGGGPNERGFGDVGVIGLKGSYHGDTIGAMDASEGSIYNKNVHWYKGRGYWFDFPQVVMKNGRWTIEPLDGMAGVHKDGETFDSLNDIFHLSRNKSARRKFYEDHIMKVLTRLTNEEGRVFGAVVMEPILLGAGGMQLW